MGALPRGYRSLADALALAVRAPGARVSTLAHSHEGRPVQAVELGPEGAPRLTVVVSGIHALEWIGVETLLAVLAAVAAAPPADRRVLFVPVLNPDGYARVEADLRAGRRRFRRGNARGVDLNRNFPTFFGQGTLGRLLPFVFRTGEEALSEPETRGLVQHLDAITRGGTSDLRFLSLHSFGGKVLFPYGGVWKRPTDVRELRARAEGIATKLRYQAVQSARWVPGFFAPGMEIDHVYETYGASALLVECSHGGRSLGHPSSYLSPFAWFNPRDPEVVAKAIADATLPFLVP